MGFYFKVRSSVNIETTLSKKSITYKTPTSSDGIQAGYMKNVNDMNEPSQSILRGQSSLEL